MIVSAILHATGSTLLKSSIHKHAVRGISLILTFVVSLCFVPFVPLPTLQTWVLLFLAALIHPVAIVLSLAALERGEMGLAYPIMRGAAPVIAAVLAFFFLREGLSVFAAMGLIMVAMALILLAGGNGSGSGSLYERYRSVFIADRAILLMALAAAAATALYSVVDAAGVRSVTNPWSYVVWFGVLVEPVCAAVLWLRHQKTFVADMRAEWRKGVLFGLITAPGFAIAIYVFSLGPVARLPALRETSVFFAAIFAAVFLKERFGHQRIVLAVVISFGLWLMHQ